MKDISSFSFNAVMPILLLIFLGYCLRLAHFADDAFFKKLNSAVFKIFLPILLFRNVYEISDLSQINWAAILYCAGAVLVIFLLGCAVTGLFFRDRRQYGVLIQCSFRSNYAIIGIPLAEALGGSAAVSFASILSAVTIPMYNIIAVFLLSHYAGGAEPPKFSDTLKKTARNPLIIGVLTGVAVVAVRSILPLGADGMPVFSLRGDLPFLYEAISSAAKIASPLALVVLGARFDFSAVRSLMKGIVCGTVMRLLVAPLIGLGCAVLLSRYTQFFQFTATEYPAFIALFSTPVAVSSAVMTAEIGGDEQLAGQLVVWTSLLSMVTMFLIIFLMKSFAFI
ncbi:MAG: AEC family transporter [Acutalibacteraceae bacterium]